MWIIQEQNTLELWNKLHFEVCSVGSENILRNSWKSSFQFSLCSSFGADVASNLEAVRNLSTSFHIHFILYIHLISYPLQFVPTSFRIHFTSYPLRFMNTSFYTHFISYKLHFRSNSFRIHFISCPLHFISTSVHAHFIS